MFNGSDIFNGNFNGKLYVFVVFGLFEFKKKKKSHFNW